MKYNYFHVEGSFGSGIQNLNAHRVSKSSRNWFDNSPFKATKEAGLVAWLLLHHLFFQVCLRVEDGAADLGVRGELFGFEDHLTFPLLHRTLEHDALPYPDGVGRRA